MSFQAVTNARDLSETTQTKCYIETFTAEVVYHVYSQHVLLSRENTG